MKAFGNEKYQKTDYITIIACAFFLNANSQFYNGHQMTFGKNKVQYYDFYWQYYRFDDFDCYFNEFGRDLAQFTAEYAQKRLLEIEDYFDYTLEKRLIFIIYNKKCRIQTVKYRIGHF